MGIISLIGRGPGACFNKHDGLSDQVTDHRPMLFVHRESSVAGSDGPSCLLKQPPGPVYSSTKESTRDFTFTGPRKHHGARQKAKSDFMEPMGLGHMLPRTWNEHFIQYIPLSLHNFSDRKGLGSLL